MLSSSSSILIVLIQSSNTKTTKKSKLVTDAIYSSNIFAFYCPSVPPSRVCFQLSRNEPLGGVGGGMYVS
jgi:hypothetical protein